MTKKDYILIARVLREGKVYCDPKDSGLIILLTIEFMTALAKDNPKFDRDKFCKAVFPEDK
jgi:hypothetical protein